MDGHAQSPWHPPLEAMWVTESLDHAMDRQVGEGSSWGVLHLETPLQKTQSLAVLEDTTQLDCECSAGICEYLPQEWCVKAAGGAANQNPATWKHSSSWVDMEASDWVWERLEGSKRHTVMIRLYNAPVSSYVHLVTVSLKQSNGAREDVWKGQQSVLWEARAETLMYLPVSMNSLALLSQGRWFLQSVSITTLF